MKYVFSENLEVLSFRISSNELSYVDKVKNLIFRNQIITTNTSDSGYLLANKYFFYSNENDYKTYFIDTETNIKQGLGYVGYPSEKCFDGEIFVTHEYLDLIAFKQQLISYNIKTNERRIIKPNAGISLLYNKKIIVREGSRFLKSLSLTTGEYLWETQLNRNGEIFKILGVREDELIVCWKRGDRNFGLLGINIHTGEIAWNMDDNELLNGHTLNFSPDGNALFCVKSGGLKSYYLELDLLTKKTLRFDEIPKFFELGLVIDRIWVKDDLIYFLAKKDSKFATVAGVMDYKTLAILWWEQVVQGSWAYLSDLQVDNDKMYVLDGEGVLHIFEKAKTEVNA